MIPTSNVLQRTFLIRHGEGTGTAFSVELKDKEYLVTASHVVADSSAETQIRHEESWKALPVSGIYHHKSGADVAIITLQKQVAPSHRVDLTTEGVMFGQATAMLGFPFGWNYTQYDLNNGFPTPFIKSAVLSAMMTTNGITLEFLDGHNNPGFSGGPIVAERNHLGRRSIPTIIGVVSGFPPESTPHPNQTSPPIKEINGYPIPDDHVHLTNSGFIKAFDIRHAIELIEDNPYGFETNR